MMILPYCWPETNRLSDISPAKTDLLRSSENCSLGSANHGEPHASPWRGRKNTFYRGEGGTEIGRTEVNRVHSFSIGWVLARQGEQCFLFLLASAIVTGQDREPSSLGPCQLISLRFLFINIFILFHRVDMGTESYKSHKSLSTVPGTSWISETTNYCSLFHVVIAGSKYIFSESTMKTSNPLRWSLF